MGEEETGAARMRESSASQLRELDPPPRTIQGEGERRASVESGAAQMRRRERGVWVRVFIFHYILEI